MRMWTKGTACAALFTAGFVAVGAGAVSPLGASADTTSGNSSLLGGNQINAPVSLPINVSGNSVAVIGAADSHSKGGASVVDRGNRDGSRGQRTSGHHSVGGGNQIKAPVKAPVNVCGNAVAVVGEALAGCEGGAKVKGRGPGYGGGQRTSGRGSVLGGNQVVVPISIPVNVCGNAAAVLGDAIAGCAGGAGGHGGHGGYGGKGGYGGHDGHENGYRTSRGAAVPQTLPTLPDQTKALPLTPGAALPALPELPVREPAGNPVAYSATQTALPIDDPTIPPTLPVGPRDLSELPATAPHGLPSLPVRTEQLTTALPGQAREATGAKHHTIPGLLPTAPKIPARPAALPGDMRSQALPIPPHDLPELPTADKVGAPRVGGVHDELGSAHEPVTGLIPMATSDLLTGGMTGGSAYVVVVGAMLAAAAVMMTFTRRIRFGRR